MQLPSSPTASSAAIISEFDAPIHEPTEEEGGDEGGGPFISSFFVKEKGCTCKAFFAPDGYRMDMKKIMDLKEKWEMEGPNTLISCDAGSVHPRQFAAIMLAKLASFETFWADANLHASKAKPGIEGAEKEAFALGVINSVIWVKLCTIFAAILDAAAVAENWIIVDRTAAKSPAADLLIEAAMEQTFSRPTILNIDSLLRLQNFKGQDGKGALAEATQAQIDKFNLIRKVRGPKTLFGVEDEPGCASINQFYDVMDFMEGPGAFHDKELPCPPEPAHVGADGRVPARVKWQYHYLATFFGSASHYIVLDSHHDAPDLSCLAPFGFVCANGQGIMFDRLRTRIQNGEALVMLHNTGGVVQAFASLRQAILEQFPVLDDSELLDRLELVSPQKWAQEFGLPEVLMVKELHQRAPMLLRTSIVSVDTMRDTSEDVLSAITCCFSSGGGIPELGLGEAETLCILTAWQRHLSCWANATRFGRTADALWFAGAAFGLLSTVLAVVYALQASGGTCAPSPTRLDVLLVLSVLGWWAASAYLDLTNPRQKWATCLMAAHQLVNQIYYYRLRCDKYDTAAAPPPLSDGTIPDIPPKMRETAARQTFVDTCSEIYSNAISSEVARGGALAVGEADALNVADGDQKSKFMLLLRAHVQSELYGLPPAEPGAPTDANPLDEADDLVSQMPIEAYMSTRTRSTAHLVRTRADLLARLTHGTHMLVLGSYLLAAALAALGVALRSSLAAAVPLCVVLNYAARGASDYFYLPSQLAATNKALKETNNLLIQYDSLSLMQRKTGKLKLQSANTVENAVLALTASQTGISPELPSEEEEEEEE